jgi:transcriptional regulator with XRE-family HTH domain
MNDEVKRVLSVLRTALKILDITNREVEKDLGQSYGYLSRLFAGTIDLKMEHILDICQAIGLRPAEFFQLAYPRMPAHPTAAAQRLRDVLQGFQPTAPPEEISSAELDRRIEQALRRLMIGGGLSRDTQDVTP